MNEEEEEDEEEEEEDGVDCLTRYDTKTTDEELKFLVSQDSVSFGYFVITPLIAVERWRSGLTAPFPDW